MKKNNTASSRKRLPARLLSITLVVALVVSFAALGGVVLAGASVAVTPAALPVSSMRVPETIWLAINSGSTSTVSRYSNVSAAGTLASNTGANSNTETSGYVYFTPGAGVTVTSLTNDSGLTVSAPSGTNPYTWTISGNLNSAVTAGGTKYVKWTVNATWNSQAITYVHYSVAYAPSNVVVGAGGRVEARYDDSYYHNDAIYAVMGVHSQGGTAYATNWKIGNADTAGPAGSGDRAAKAQLISDIVSPMADTGGWPHGNNHTNYADPVVGSLYLQTGGGVSYGWSNSVNDDCHRGLELGGKLGYINVDSSRFSNLQNVPGLKMVYIQCCDQHTTNGDHYQNCGGTSRVDWPNPYGASSLRMFTFSNSSGAQQEGCKFAYSTPRTGDAPFYQAITNKHAGDLELSTDSETRVGDNAVVDNFACLRLKFGLSTKCIDKSGARNVVKDAVKYPTQWINAFDATLQAAASVVGNPTNTATSASAAQVLTTKTATASYVNDATGANITGITNPDSATYKHYDKVEGAYKDLSANNYWYRSIYDSPTATNQSGNGSAVNAANIADAAYGWKFHYYPIYTVTYNPQASPAPNPLTFSMTYNTSSVNVSSVIPTKDGYTFAGWQVSGADVGFNGTIYQPTNPLSNKLRTTPGSVFLTATWTQNTYKIKYDPGPGSGGGERTVIYDTNYSAATGGIPSASRPGYAFGGWFTAKDGAGNGTGTQITASTAVTSATMDPAKGPTETAATFFAKWTALNYQVNFDHAGGTLGGLSVSGPFSVTYDQTYDAVIPSGLPFRAGYEFQGWWTGTTQIVPGVRVNSETLSGPSMANNASPTSFLAKWNTALYTLKFELEGGNIAGVTTTQTVQGIFGQALNVPIAPLRTGYRFNGWWTGQNGTGSQIPASFPLGTPVLSQASIENPAVPTNYYAWWVKDDYNLIWSLEGGTQNGNLTPNPTTPSILYNEPYTLPGGLIERAGYTFGGWWTQPNGGGVQILPGMTATEATLNALSMNIPAVATVFYAKWMYDGVYTVTYELEGGRIDANANPTDPVSFSVTLNTSFADGTNIPAVPTKTGYKFEGWFFTKPGGGELEIVDGLPVNGDVLSLESIADPEDATVYSAKWSPVTYRVEFDDQNGTVTPADVAYDTNYTLPAQPVRSGYFFGGWWTNNNGTGMRITNSVNADYLTLDPTITTGVAETFYAHWVPIEYTMAYDFNGAIETGNEPAAITVAYGFTNVPAAPVVTRTGYDFVRWDVLGGDNGVTAVAAGVSPGKTLSKTDGAAVTLKAVWSPSANTPYKVRVYLADELGAYGSYTDINETGTTNTTAAAAPAAYNSDPSLYVFEEANAGNKLSGTIEAEGSLVLKLYYQRTKVQLSVNLDGGSGGESGILGVFPWGYEKTLIEPVKQGYAFGGWTVNVPSAGVDGAVVTVGKADTIAKATWVPANAAYAIEVYLEDDGGSYPAAASETLTGLAGTTGATITLAGDGSEWTAPESAYYNFAAGLSDTGGTVRADGSLVLKLFFTRKTYNLYTVPANPGVTPVLEGTYRWGEKVTLTQPSYTGYDFSVWTIDAGPADAGVVGGTATVGKGDTYVKANWANAADTRYKINVFLQQADAAYAAAPDEVITLSGTTGTNITLDGTEWLGAGTLYAYDQVKTEAGSYTGPIAADGSLELNLYYKRTLVSLTADANGGTGGSDGAIGSFPWGSEQALTQPAAPAGYDFAGWSVTAGGAYASVSGSTVTMGREATSVQARWVPAVNTYKIEVYRENAAGTYVQASPDAVKNGVTGTNAVADITEFVLDPDLYVFDAANSGNVPSGVIAANGTTALKLYYKRALISLAVDANGGTGGGLVGSFRWESTKAVEVPTAPAGMEFDGWEIRAGGTGAGVSGNTVTLGREDTVVKAKWKASTANYKVQVYTQNADGSYTLVQTATGSGATSGQPYIITKADYNPSPTSYIDDPQPGDLLNVASVEPGGGSEFVLKFARHPVTLTVDLDGGTAGGVAAGTSGHLWGAAVELGANPAKANYTFAGWSVTGSGAYFIAGKLVVGTTDTKITANWIRLADSVKRYTVNVYLQQPDGSYALSTNFLMINRDSSGEIFNHVTLDGSEWSDPNYTFDAGNTNNVLEADIMGDNLTDPQQLKLYYARKPVSLTVDLDGGTAAAGGIAAGSYRWGQNIALGTQPTKAGCVFSHWSVETGAGAGIVNNELTLGTVNTTIKAHWIDMPDVIYEVDIYLMGADGNYSGTAAQTVKKSAQAGPGNATADGSEWSGAGYAFAGTHAGNVTAADLNADGTTSVRLKLHYARTAAGFDVLDGGSNTVADPGDLVWGEVINLDAQPEKPGYVFVCWQHTSGTGSLSGNRLTVGVDDVVEAKWIPESWALGANYKVFIFLQLADGTYAAIPDAFVAKSGITGMGNAAAAADDWSGAGYEYDKGAGTADLNANGTTSSALNLFYKRTLVNLTVQLNGGTGGTADQTGLRWGQELTLSNPTREGYTFNYWRVTAGEGAGITAGNKLILGSADTAIEAVWTENAVNTPDDPNGSGKKSGCKLPDWLTPFVNVGMFLLGFGAGWTARTITFPWWKIVLGIVLGGLFFPILWWIILL